MTDPTIDYLVRSVADMPDRRAFKVAVTEQRDLSVRRGESRMAEVWNSLACLVADIEDGERATLRAMADDLSPVVRELTAEELADVRFDDESPC